MLKKLSLLMLLLCVSSCGQSARNPESAATEKTPDETATIAMLKEINQAQADFIRRERRYAQTYDELVTARLLNEKPSTAKTGYSVLMQPSPDAVSYSIVATPSSSSSTARHLFTDQTGVIRAEQGRNATVQSPEM